MAENPSTKQQSTAVKSTENERVVFCGADNENGYLSQMFLADIENWGTTYNCNEQFFQKAKANWFEDKVAEDNIMQAVDPKEQKKLGKSVKKFDAKQWDERKCAFSSEHVG